MADEPGRRRKCNCIPAQSAPDTLISTDRLFQNQILRCLQDPFSYLIIISFLVDFVRGKQPSLVIRQVSSIRMPNLFFIYIPGSIVITIFSLSKDLVSL